MGRRASGTGGWCLSVGDLGTAWVLGNGPTLPVAALPRLASEFTVGVNRILESGFEPSVLFWYDVDGFPEWHWETVRASRACKVSSDLNGNEAFADWCLPRGPWTSWVRDWNNPRELVISGSSGIAAARWCVALGFSRVNLLGFGGQGHFYDPAPYEPAEVLFRCELDRRGPKCHQADDPAQWELGGEWTRGDVRGLLTEVLHGLEA